MAAPHPSEWPKLGEIDPDLKEVLDASPEPSASIADAPDIPAARQAMLAMMAQLMSSGLIPVPDMTGIHKEEIQIPVRDGSTVRAVLIKPESGPPGPLAVFYHAGGWCIGMPEMEEGNQIMMARRYGATSVSVDYRKAPENVFPVAAEDSIDALIWCASNAAKLGADPSKGFLVGGTSAGGQLASIVALEARDKKLSPPLTAVWMAIPATCSPEAVPEKWKPHYTAYERNKHAPGLDVAAIEFFRKWYKPDPKSPYFNPILWPTGFKNLPPTYFQVCGLDPLRDDGLIYEATLRENGVKTKIDLYPGVPHAFEAFYPQLPLSAKVIPDREVGFDWLMGKK